MGGCAWTHVQGRGAGLTCSCWEVRGLVLTRVPPACVLLCQRGRASSTGEGGQGGTMVKSRDPGWDSRGQLKHWLLSSSACIAWQETLGS